MPLLSNAVPTGSVHPLPTGVLEKPVGRVVWLKPGCDNRMMKKPENRIFLAVQFRERVIKNAFNNNELLFHRSETLGFIMIGRLGCRLKRVRGGRIKFYEDGIWGGAKPG